MKLLLTVSCKRETLWSPSTECSYSGYWQKIHFPQSSLSQIPLERLLCLITLKCSRLEIIIGIGFFQRHSQGEKSATDHHHVRFFLFVWVGSLRLPEEKKSEPPFVKHRTWEQKHRVNQWAGANAMLPNSKVQSWKWLTQSRKGNTKTWKNNISISQGHLREEPLRFCIVSPTSQVTQCFKRYKHLYNL